MGKKSKTQIKNSTNSNINYNIANSTKISSINQGSLEKVQKISKKQKKKLRNKQKLQNIKNSTITNEPQLQKQQLQKDIQVQQSHQDLSDFNIQNAIQLSSGEMQQQFNGEIEFNPKGKQGFDDLINDNDQNKNDQTQYKFIQYRKKTNYLEGQNFYLYQLKMQTFYKVNSHVHQRINSTHLNDLITLKVIQNSKLNNNCKSSQKEMFWMNGKNLDEVLQFMKSAVFKITKVRMNPENSNSSKSNKKKTKSNIFLQQNIFGVLQPSSSEEQQNILQFLRDYQWNQDCLLLSKQQLSFSQTQAPFRALDQNIFENNSSLMILGKKNTGKSTLAEYIKNMNSNSVCILDCDIGRSLTIAGCVTLITPQQNVNLWVGEFTPFNCIKTYIKAIQELYTLYRVKYFSKKLVINTMGYLNGLGQMMIYEIYNLINPSELIVLNSQNGKQGFNNQFVDTNISSIVHNIKSGKYMNKLISLSEGFTVSNRKRYNQNKSSLAIYQIFNAHAQSKGIPVRFENILCYKKNVKNLTQLIHMIKRKDFQKLSQIQIYQQDKLGNIVKLDESLQGTKMRIVLIGKIFQSQENYTNNEHSNTQKTNQRRSGQLFQIFGIGYSYQNSIYYSLRQIQHVLSPNLILKQQFKNLIGIINEGVDFQKNFYQISQLSLIDLELQYGPVPYYLPIIKGIGSKGVRNNPAKSI